MAEAVGIVGVLVEANKLFRRPIPIVQPVFGAHPEIALRLFLEVHHQLIPDTMRILFIYIVSGRKLPVWGLGRDFGNLPPTVFVKSTEFLGARGRIF
jgi:hypothetical protein